MPRYMTAPCCPDLEHLHKKSRYQLQENNPRKLGVFEEVHIWNFLFTNGVRNFRVSSVIWMMVGPQTSNEGGRPDTPHQAGGGAVVRALLKMAADKLQKKHARQPTEAAPQVSIQSGRPARQVPWTPVLEEAA
jgi:hypothetical protein